jgi:hypothetical protein
MMVTIAWNSLGFHLLDGLPKGTHLMPSTTVLIFSRNFFPFARRLMGGDSLFVLTAQEPTPPENVERFAKKIGSASAYTHHTHLISHHPTFSLRAYQTLSAGNHFSIREELLAAIHEIVGAVSRPALEDVFRH